MDRTLASHGPPSASDAGHGWRGALARLGVDLRPGEGIAALLLFSYFFLIITFQYACKSVRQAEYIDRLGAEALPVVYLLVALSSLPVLAVYSRFCDRMPRHHLIAATSLIVAASVLGFWALLERPGSWVPVAFYVWISIVFVLNVSQFWSYANHVFDPRQAKRLFGFIGAGGLLGGVAGGQVAAVATRLVGARFSLIVAALVLVLTAGLIYVIHAQRGGRLAPDAGAAGLARLAEARGGFKVIRRSRHLLLITATMLVTVVVAQVVDLLFSSAVEQSTTTLEQRAAFFGNFYSVMGLAAFAFQLLFTARIHRALGIGVALRVLPGTLAAGSATVLVAAAGFPALLLPAAMGLKVAENGIRYSLDQTTRELLFMPIPSSARLKAKATIDVFVQRLGKGVAAVILLPVTLGLLPALQVGWISLALIAGWLVIAAAMRRQYVETFRGSLRGAVVDTASPVDLQDATTIELLIQSLDSDDTHQVLMSLDLLEYHGRSYLVPRLLLLHEDAAVRRRTLQVLARSGRREAASLVERAMEDDDVGVRVEAAHAMARLLGEDAAALMAGRLDDPDPRIRSAAIAAVAGDGGGNGRERQAERSLESLLSDADAECRIEAAKALGAMPDPVFDSQLVRLLMDSERPVARQAILAVGMRMSRGEFNPIYPPLLVSRMSDRRLKHDARDALVACGPAVIPALVHFMNAPEEQLWVRRALPKTMARIGTPEAATALVEALGTADAFLRRKVAEALAELRVDGHGLTLVAGALDHRILEETGRYMRDLTDLLALGPGDARREGPLVRWEGRPPSLVHELLADRLRGQVNQIFGLLALCHDADDMEAARRGLLSGKTVARTRALEYLDNRLKGESRWAVMVALGDVTQRVWLEHARRSFGIELQDRASTLARLITTPAGGDGDAAWLAAAAIHAVLVLREADLYPLVRETAAGGGDPLVRETAAWVATQLDRPA